MTVNEQDQLERIDRARRIISVFEERAGAGGPGFARPGSDLEGDDLQLGTYNSTLLLGHCLGVSLDTLRGTRLLLTAPEGNIQLPLVAHYPLLRTAIESASLAVWALAPDSRRERLKRVLQIRLDELIEDDRLLRTLTSEEPGDSKSDLHRKQRTRREHVHETKPKKMEARTAAEASGISYDEIVHGHPGFGPIIGEIGPLLGPGATRARGVWSYLSGVSHSSYTRVLSASDLQVIPGTDSTRAWQTTRPSTTSLALDAAMLARITLLNLIADRGDNEDIRWQKLQLEP